MDIGVDKDGYSVNYGDDIGDDSSSLSPIQIDIRKQSIEAILRAVNKGYDPVVKIWPRNFELYIQDYHMVSGYVTMARFLLGATPEQFEKMLGFKTGLLKNGIYMLYVHTPDLNKDNVAARYLTSFSAGVSPRDLMILSEKSGENVQYHPDYPAAEDPIPQFVIHRDKKVRANLHGVFGYKDRYDEIW